MSNTKKFAEHELKILVKSAIDPDNRPIIEEFIPEIIALCEKFGNSGQNGGSAPFTALALSKAIESLCLQKPICPITGIEEEWGEVTDGNKKKDILYQNNRCSALFKDGYNRAYYLDAIVWKDEKGHTYTGSAALSSAPNDEKIRSRQFVRFPFEPKTFYVDVISKEVKKDDWEFYVKDEKQLDKAFNYYKSPWSRNVLVEKY